MSIKQILEELISQGWFGKVTDRTEGKFFDDKKDVDREVSKALAQIKLEMMGCVPKKKECHCEEQSVYDTRITNRTAKCVNCNYNQSLTETLARIESKFKEEK